MKIKCDYCGNMTEDTEGKCPYCGAELSGVDRFAGDEPKTVAELQQWYAAHGLPPENVTRFFIGKDIKEPKAIGIYEENGIFTVYKNKADGERAVRYKGSDEAYAVNEIYQKLKSEIVNQKRRNAERSAGGNNSSSRKRSSKNEPDILTMLIYVGFIGFFMVGGILFAIFDKTPSNGYYRYNNTDYYYQDQAWYYYDDLTDNWYVDTSGIEDVFGSSSSDYRVYDHEGEPFEDSDWYHESSSDSWDDDSSWDSDDSWDSDSMDWDSDW